MLPFISFRFMLQNINTHRSMRLEFNDAAVYFVQIHSVKQNTHRSMRLELSDAAIYFVQILATNKTHISP